MILDLEAIFEDGVLKPKTPLTLVEGTAVRLTIRAIDEPAARRRANELINAEGSGSAEPSLARRTSGLIGWTGDPEVVRRIALDPAFALGEDPALDAAEDP